MTRRPVTLVSALCLLAASCTSITESEPVDPGRLVVWNDEAIGLLIDGAVSEIESEGAVSQVTAARDGSLVWTRVKDDPPTVSAVIDGATRIDLETPTVPFFHEWNPISTRVAFLGNSPSGVGLVFGMIDVEDGSVTSVESPAPFFFDWSPDGERLIAHVAGSSLGIIEADTGEIEALPEVSGTFPAPIWSERGIVVVARIAPTVRSPIVPVAYQSLISAVVLIDPSDNTRTRLAEVDAPVRLFAGAENLALVGGVAGDQRIEVIGWDGSSRATLGEGTIEVAQWSPDGSQLLWTERGRDGQLTPMTWDGTDPVEHAPFEPSTVFSAAYLPFWDQYDRAISLWSANSAAFALPSSEGVIVYETDGESSTYAGWEMAAWSATPPDD